MPRAAAALVLLLGAALPARAAHWTGTRLPASGLDSGDQFGAAVAVSAQVIAVGAHDAGAGAVHLYRRVDGIWTPFPGQPLREPGASRFGFDVALNREGTQLLVGAPGTGGCGKAFLYDLDAGAGSVAPRTLPPLDACKTGDDVGSSVAIESGVLAVGARGADRRAGRVYVLLDGGSSFQQTKAPPGLVPGSELGQSLAVSGRWLVAGAPAPYPGTGIAGAAYVVDLKSDERPLPVEMLPHPSLPAGAAFGYAVAVSGDVIVVGAPLRDREAGALFRYRRDEAAGEWDLETEPVAAGAAGDQLGVAVALDGGRLVAGARYARSGRAGAAYLYGHGELTSPRPASGAEFGFSAAVRGETAVVGAFKQDGTGAAYVFEPVHVPVVRLVVAPVRVPEGAGSVAVTVEVITEDGAPLARQATVRLATTPGSATDGTDGTDEDYLPISEVIVLSEGQRSVTRPLEILSDLDCEAHETFTVFLSDPTDAMLGEPGERAVTVTILNDDPGGIELAPDPLTTFETGVPVRLGVNLTCPPAAPVVVSLAASAGAASFDRPQLTFTPADWNVRQTVNVRGTDDAACFPPAVSYAVTASSASVDPPYAPRTIEARNLNDDVTCITGTMEVCPSADGTVVYTIALDNSGTAGQRDLDSHELVDFLPPALLTVVSAAATGGAATVDYAENVVAWNGPIPAGGDIVITIVAALHEVPPPMAVSNKARITFDRDRRPPLELLTVPAPVFGAGDVCPPPVLP